MNEKLKKTAIRILLIFLMGSILLMVLWNWLMPTVFGLKTIHLGEAAGFFFMARLLFGRYPFWSGNKRMNYPGRHQFREKWEKMTPEERKSFIEQRRQKGFGPHFKKWSQ